METETSSATNQVPAPAQNHEILAGFYVEIPNPIVLEPPAQALTTKNSNRIIEPVKQSDQMADDSDDDLIIVTPPAVDIKREQRELALELAKKCNPNVLIDIIDDENVIIMKTEVNDENIAPNRANAMEYPIRRNIMAKKPQKPTVERCVGRICAPNKRPRTNDVTSDDGAADEVNESEYEMISDSEDEMVSHAEGQRVDTEPGIIDATEFNLFALRFQQPIAHLVPAYRQQAVTSIPNIPYCRLCNSVHANQHALRCHYGTKKHKSKVLQLAREAAREDRSSSPVYDNQNPIRVLPKNRHQSTAEDDLLHCQECEFTYKTKQTWLKHLKSLKHAENLSKAASENTRLSFDSIESD